MFADELVYQCQYCGSINSIEADYIHDKVQEFEEECVVCARPNMITLTKDEYTKQFHIEAHAETD